MNRPAAIFRVLRRLTLAAALLAWAGGCANYNQKIAATMQDYRAGDFAGAADALKGSAEQRGPDRLLLMLERGKALQDAGRFRESIAQFVAAEQLTAVFDQQAEVRLGEEIGATLTDQTVREYRGTYGDRILLNTYQALNYVCVGEVENARAELRQAYNRQQEAVQKYAGRIKSLEGRARRMNFGDAAADHPESLLPDARTIASANGGADPIAGVRSMLSPAYAAYANPLTTFLSGLLGYAGGDPSNAAVDLRKAAAMVPANSYLADEVEGAGVDRALEEGRPVVYVVFENGLGPRRYPIQIPILIPGTGIRGDGYGGLTSRTGLSVISLPGLEAVPPVAGGLLIRAASPAASPADPPVRTETVSDLNAVVAGEFYAELPAAILREAISTAAKEAAVYALQQQVGSDWGVILGTAYKLITSSPDLRTWRTIGADVQIARLPRPTGGRLTLDLIGPGGGAYPGVAVDVPDAPLTLICARGVGGHLVAHVVPVAVEPPSDAGAFARRPEPHAP